jgi:hypothetical protein
MATTHDDATSWRDLADQLTAEQIVGLEGCERRFNTDGVADDPRAQAPRRRGCVLRTVARSPAATRADL